MNSSKTTEKDPETMKKMVIKTGYGTNLGTSRKPRIHFVNNNPVFQIIEKQEYLHNVEEGKEE